MQNQRNVRGRWEARRRPGRPRKDESGVLYPQKTRASDISDKSRVEEIRDSEDSETLVRAVKAAIAEAESGDFYLRFCRNLIEGYKFWHGDQWLDSDLSPIPSVSYRIRITRNITFHTIEAANGLLLDVRPTPYYVCDFPDKTIEELRAQREQIETAGELENYPQLAGIDFESPAWGPNDVLARNFTEIIHAEHDRRGEEVLLSDLLHDVTIAGLGVRKHFWDTRHNRPGIALLNPMDVLIDPYCRDRRREGAEYVILRKEMDAADVKRIYGLSNHEMRKVLDSAQSDPMASDTLYFPKNPYPLFWNRGAQLDTNHLMGRTRIMVYEMWYLGENLFALEHGEQRELKYPNGRVLTIAGDVLLYDKPNDYGFLPLTFYQNYGEPRDPYGFGDVATFKSEQIGTNVLLSQILMNAILMANAQWVYEQGAIERDQLTNEPGLAIPVPRGMINAVQRLPGMPVDPSLFRILAEMGESVKTISNINETVMGAMPQTHTSGTAIQTAQNAAFLRTRMKARELEYAYRDDAYKQMRIVQEFYDFSDPLAHGEMAEGEWLRWDERMRELPVDVRIESRADLPANWSDRLQVAMQALNVGVLDQLGALEFIGIFKDPRYMEKLRQADALQQMQMQMTMAQLQAQMGGGMVGAQMGGVSATPGEAPGRPPGSAEMPMGPAPQ